MKRKVLIVTVILLLSLTALSQAQLPGGKWWKLKEIAKEVNLSKEQVKEIERIFIDHKKHLIDIKAAFQKEKLDLEAMFDEDEFDEKAITVKIDKVEDARSELHKAQLMFFVSIRKVLSREQYVKLCEKKDEFNKLNRRKRRNKKRGMNENKEGSVRRNRTGMKGEPPCPDPPCME